MSYLDLALQAHPVWEPTPPSDGPSSERVMETEGVCLQKAPTLQGRWQVKRGVLMIISISNDQSRVPITSGGRDDVGGAGEGAEDSDL